MRTFRLGVDASNIRAGGGLTYLSSLLEAAARRPAPQTHIVVWAGDRTLAALPSASCITKMHHRALDGPLHTRIIWQRYQLDNYAAGCDVLFVPGGTYLGTYRPFVTMSHNLLPFEYAERRRYGASKTRLRLEALRVLQARTFRRADGVIFLTHAAQKAVETTTGPIAGPRIIVPHGIDHRFLKAPRNARPITAYSRDNPFRWLYMSIVNLYKHQWNVVAATARLRASGIPIELDLVGPAYPPALKRLREAMVQYDPASEFVRYHGPLRGSELVEMYHGADALVFASTCENMPIILLEGMSAGLPIVCSERPVMREVLQDGGVYCDPESIDDLEHAMREVSLNVETRQFLANRAFALAGAYSWDRCADSTFAFLRRIAETSRSPR